MGDLIAIGTVLWLVLGVIGAVATAGDDPPWSVTASIFFWPLTLPIFLVFGALFAVWSALRYSFGWFKNA